jgi:hypothetical protein
LLFIGFIPVPLPPLTGVTTTAADPLLHPDPPQKRRERKQKINKKGERERGERNEGL